MKKTQILIAFYLVCLFFSVYSQDYKKNYFNNVLSGARERIVCQNDSDKNNFSITNLDIIVDLYQNYSKFNLKYRIKNNGKNTRIKFQYPRLDASVTKVFENHSPYPMGYLSTKSENLTIDGDYNNFDIKVNDKQINFDIIEENNIPEYNIPFKIANTKSYTKAYGEWYKEFIDSFVYYYNWYNIDLNFNKNETKIIEINYIAFHYYNEVISKGKLDTSDIEDPALMYEYIDIDSNRRGLSEKVFQYNFETSYSDNQLIVNESSFMLNSHLLNDDYLKILSSDDYKKKGSSYIWFYKNLYATSINNVLVRISPTYSSDSVSKLLLDIKPVKNSDIIDSNYVINTDKENLYIEYLDKNNKKYGLVNISEIRIQPLANISKDSIKQVNKILEAEICFYRNDSLTNGIRITKTLTVKDYEKLIGKNNYLSLYKGDPVLCKIITIKVTQTSNPNDKVITLSDIELLKE